MKKTCRFGTQSGRKWKTGKSGLKFAKHKSAKHKTVTTRPCKHVAEGDYHQETSKTPLKKYRVEVPDNYRERFCLQVTLCCHGKESSQSRDPCLAGKLRVKEALIRAKKSPIIMIGLEKIRRFNDYVFILKDKNE